MKRWLRLCHLLSSTFILDSEEYSSRERFIGGACFDRLIRREILLYALVFFSPFPKGFRASLVDTVKDEACEFLKRIDELELKLGPRIIWQYVLVECKVEYVQ